MKDQPKTEEKLAQEEGKVLKFLPLTKTERIQKAPPSPKPKGEKIYKKYLPHLHTKNKTKQNIQRQKVVYKNGN